MNNKLNQLLITSLLAVGIISLSACSSDDDKSGNSPTGTVTTENARSLVIASAEGTSIQQQAGEVPAADMTDTMMTALQTAFNATGTMTGVQNLGFPECGGENGSFSITGFNLPNPSGSITFVDYCIDLSNTGTVSSFFTLNGKLTIAVSGLNLNNPNDISNLSVKVTFNNFSAAYNGVTTQVSGSITFGISASNQITVTNSTTVTSEGQTFQVEGLSIVVNQDGSIAINGGLTANSMTYDIQSTTSLIYNAEICSNGAPASGTIELIGANGSSATADFDTADCNTFALCIIDGAGKAEVCTTEYWALPG